MLTRSTLRLVAAATILVAVSFDLTWFAGAPLAQQANQTDLEFARERARVAALEHRIETLQQRLAASGSNEESNAREHVLLGRDVGLPTSSSSTNSQRRATGSTAGSERRVPQALRHRDRSLTAEDAAALGRRLDSARQTARSLGERVNRPDFGAGLRALERDVSALEVEISRIE